MVPSSATIEQVLQINLFYLFSFSTSPHFLLVSNSLNLHPPPSLSIIHISIQHVSIPQTLLLCFSLNFQFHRWFLPMILIPFYHAPLRGFASHYSLLLHFVINFLLHGYLEFEVLERCSIFSSRNSNIDTSINEYCLDTYIKVFFFSSNNKNEIDNIMI